MRNAARARKLLSLLGAVLAVASAGLAAPARAQCTTPGQVPCGDNYCVWDRQTCCASAGHPEKYCPYGRECSTDGQSCLGSAISCGVGAVGVISSCGTDECTCQVACTSSASCSTGCCAPAANGTGTSYCAPSCVCQGQGALIAYCGAAPLQVDAGVHDASPRRDGGSSDPNGPSADPFGGGCGKDKDRDGGSTPVPLMALVGARALRRRARR